MIAIVSYKDGGDIDYADIRSWKVQGDFIVLYRSRTDIIIVPKESFTCVEIHPDDD